MDANPLLFDANLPATEIIELDPEDFDRAGKITDRLTQNIDDETQAWQIYLNTLASFGFQRWLHSRMPDISIEDLPQNVDGICYLKVGEFILAIVAIEDSSETIVSISQRAIEIPENTAHFYVAMEILEERQQAIVRGFLRFDRLEKYRQTQTLSPDAGNAYPIPFAEFESNLDRLLLNLRFLTPAAIPLPMTETTRESAPASVTESPAEAAADPPIQLRQWLENVFDAGWQAVETLVGGDGNWTLAVAAGANREPGVKRAKLLDFGMAVDNLPLALLVAVAPEAEEKVGIRIQIHPAGEGRYLPPDLCLAMLSPGGETVQEVRSRQQDSCIQLKRFKTKPGKGFRVRVGLGDRSVTEEFSV